MNAAETIAAAIEKFETLKASSTPSDWVVVGGSIHGTRGNYDPLIDAGDYAASSEKFENPADAALIVMLHRTIDAQLAILRAAAEAFEKVSGLDPDWGLEVDLARSILGEDGQSVDASRLGVPAATASETGFDLELGEDGTAMNIPEEVLERADEAFFDAEGDGLTASYAVIAEWARREALREVAEAIESLDGSRATGYYASEAHSGYQEAQNDAEAAIRALVEGEPK